MAQDPAPTPTLGGGATLAKPTKASVAQPSNMPKNCARLLAELQGLAAEPLPERAAALYVGHLIATLGKAKVEALKAGEVSELLKSFRARASLAGQALRVADAVRFSRQLQSFGEPRADAQEYLRLLHEVLQAAKV
jgi:hypothetical protein